jgi:hypothetical protein
MGVMVRTSLSVEEGINLTFIHSNHAITNLALLNVALVRGV